MGGLIISSLSLSLSLIILLTESQYGNEPGIDTFYSAATIVAHIEPRVTETEAETSEAAETKPGEWSD